MRVLLWHGYLLEGSGSNVAAARTAEALRAMGHDVLLLCQEGDPERYPWIDAWGSVDERGPSATEPNVEALPVSGGGRCTLLRPDIGSLLPVFVVDEYEGFEVKAFPDLTDDELERYLSRNADAMRAAARSHGSEMAIVGHIIPGGPVAARGFDAGRFVVKVHGSDLEYALRPQQRYRRLAADSLTSAGAVAGPSEDVLRRCDELVGGLIVPTHVVPPGVDIEAFHPMGRHDALLATASRLDADRSPSLGRPASLDGAVARAVAGRDADALTALALDYDQRVADPDAANRLRVLADRDRPLVGSFGKLIPQKGAELLLAAARLARSRPDVLVVGFGLYREWVAALAHALEAGDRASLAWLQDQGVVPAEVSIRDLLVEGGDAIFTGRLDHRYAPGALAAMDVLVVPSVMDEAFGMVALEGAASGALPLVARHSGLAEIAEALEAEVGRPELFSFEPGSGVVAALAEGLDRLIELDPDERGRIRDDVVSFVGRTWSWRHTAERLLSLTAET